MIDFINSSFRVPEPAGNYMFKVNNRNSRTRCEISLKLTTCSSVSIVDFEQVNAGWEGVARNRANTYDALHCSIVNS